MHHIDGDLTNNDKSNLILLSKEDHWHLSKYQRRNKFIISIIIGLAIFYTVTIILVNTPILNNEIALSLARISVYAIIFLGLELKFNWIEKWIKKPSNNQAKQ